MQHGKYRFIVGFLVVPMALYVIFVIWPFIQSIYYSFTDWTGLSPDFKMVGFDNYTKMLDDDIFWKSLQHSVLLAVLLPLVTLGLALFFAFMLNVGGRRRKGAAVTGVRGSGFYKIAYFFPQVLSIAIVAILFQFAFDPAQGMINGTLKAVGISDVPDWLGDPELGPVVHHGGPRLVHDRLLRGAVLRGHGLHPQGLLRSRPAGRGEPLHDLLPDHAAPAVGHGPVPGWVYMGILALGAEGFAIVHIMSVGPGGPDYSTTVLPLYVYQAAFRDGQAGYATTIGVALLIVTLAFAAIVMRVGRRERLEF
ncbi:sugar ABC transporter permease [Streptomyces] [Streptomyces griseus]